VETLEGIQMSLTGLLNELALIPKWKWALTSIESAEESRIGINFLRLFSKIGELLPKANLQK